MIDKKIVAIVQARITSTRFKKKVMKKIGKFSIVDLIFKRLKKSKLINQVVFAIPATSTNDELNNYIKKKKYNIYRGNENDVLARYYYSAIKFKASIIIRITADSPLTDPKIIDKMLKIYLKKKLDYFTSRPSTIFSISNYRPVFFPDGFTVEIFPFKLLEMAKNNAFSEYDLEHVTPYIQRLKKIKKEIYLPKFKKKNYEHFKKFSLLKLSVDTKNDLERVKKIYKYFYPNIFFSYDDICNTKSIEKFKKK